ncbi:MAG: hypothetical protein HKN27_09025 [Silicimonas sp.]|nr:hypothetical protein [Silicimonas sp.]
MSGAPAAGPNEDFHDRLNRVAEVREPREAARQPVSVLPDWKAAFVGPVGIGLAVLVGMLSVVAVRIAFFHINGAAMIGANPNVMMAMEAAAALFASFLVFLILPYKGAMYNFLQFLGVVVMISMMHNLVHKAPGVFSLAFSPQWTQTVTTVTEPNSFFVRGQSVPFIKEPKAEKTMPKVRRG